MLRNGPDEGIGPYGVCESLLDVRVPLPSSVSRLRGTREPPSPRGKAGETDCHVGRWPPRNDMRYFRICSYYAAFPANPDRPAEAP